MQRGNVYRVRIPSTVFTGALAAAGAAAFATITKDTAGAEFPQALSAGKHMRSRILEIRIASVQAIKWGLQFYGKAVPLPSAVVGTIDTQAYLGEWSFGNTNTPGDGQIPTGDAFARYYINGLDIAYQDLDNAGQLNIRLVNWDGATAKLAGATGNITIELAMELLQGI